MKVRELDLSQDEFQLIAICELLNGPQFDWPAEKLRSEIQFSEVLVLEDQKQIKAFVLFRRACKNVLEILALATNPAFMREGCMSYLLSHFCNAYGQDVEFWLEVHEGNIGAQSLYEKWGFEKKGLRPQYYSDGAAAILYTRSPDL